MAPLWIIVLPTNVFAGIITEYVVNRSRPQIEAAHFEKLIEAAASIWENIAFNFYLSFFHQKGQNIAHL